MSTYWMVPKEIVNFVSARSSTLRLRCFAASPNSKIEKLQRNRLLHVGWLTNLPRFQGAWAENVRVENSSYCFPRELVSFVRPRELVSFHPRHMTRFPPIGKSIWVGRYNNNSLGRTKLTNSLWKQQLELSTLTFSGHAPLNCGKLWASWRKENDFFAVFFLILSWEV